VRRRGTFNRARAALQREEGFALVLAVGVSTVLGILGTTLALYSSHNSSLASRSSNDQKSFSLAEAGLNDAIAVLSNPQNNSLSPGLLCAPGAALPCDLARANVSTYDGGVVKWWGVLDQLTSTWTISSYGYTRNPAGATAPVLRFVRTSVHITPTVAQPLNNPAWNYVMALHTGSTCDMTIGNSVNITAPLYVFGNLCFGNTAWMSAGSLVVKGHLTLAQPQNSVGLASAPISDAHVGNGCDYQSKKSQLPCTGGASVNVFAKTIDEAVPPVVPPTVDWDTWYKNASPGPMFPCVAAKSSPPATWPTFDTDTTLNASVGTIWNLTPATAYDCWTDGGELKWDPVAKQLTASGTIFIDGSAMVNNGAVNTYVGQAGLYLSGTFLVKNSSLCAVSTCTSTGWDPNKALLIVVANGNGGQVPVGDSIQIVSGSFQGGLYGTNAVETDTTANVDGPILGATVILGQSVNSSFPFITIVPVSTPGNPVVYAQPDAPTGFSG
jgi:Tfp pilus assembly protein PilX